MKRFQQMIDKNKIIVALDFDDIKKMHEFIEMLDPKLCRLKIGKEMFTRYGPNCVHQIHNKGFEIFLDLKFHDIPTTVYKACLSAFSLNIWMLNIHLSGGIEMASSAVRAKNDSQTKTKLIGVTVLTSLSDDDCKAIYGSSRKHEIDRLKDIGLNTNIDGFVCSPDDINTISNDQKLFVTPGIRLDKSTDDHHKVWTPIEAMNLGASYLVIGRSITSSKDPNKTLVEILRSLQE
tara:strand:+ start:1309 stop:2010 length:702 start_codon:yes stop_codon:yes gene_type:complete